MQKNDSGAVQRAEHMRDGLVDYRCSCDMRKRAAFQNNLDYHAASGSAHA